MDDNEATQPLDAVPGEDTQVMPPAEDSPASTAGKAPAEVESLAASDGATPTKTGVARLWFAAAVILVLLAAVGVGVYLGMRDEEASEVAEEAEEVVEDELVAVPDLRGMTLERATTDAEAAGLTIGETATAFVDEAVTPAGTVLSQDPLPGAEVESGSVIALVIAAVAPADAAQPPAGGSSGAGGAAAADPPAPPQDLSIEDVGLLTVVPRPIDLGLIQLQQWTTVLEHSDIAMEWTSGTVTLGGGGKRILLTADGPSGYLVGVWSWDAVNDTDWTLESIVVSQPGGASFETVLDAPAGNHTFLVKSNNTAVHWTVKVQEKK